MGRRVSAPAVLTAAGSGVHGAVGVAKQITVGGAASAVSGVLSGLLLVGVATHTERGARHELGLGGLQVCYAPGESQ